MTELQKALLVSIRTPHVTDTEERESLIELERLVKTLGFKVIGKESQRQATTTSIKVVGEGKLKELARYTGGKGSLEKDKKNSRDTTPEEAPLPLPSETANVVVFDCELSPAQIRNMETALGVKVLDRTGIIIEIFSAHAKTRAAQLQVEMARQSYLAPRLREKGPGKERHSGRGPGETGLEIEKRKIRDRMAELRRELIAVQKDEESRRSQRSAQLCVALVGYTNAGKSSLMRALTGSDVLVVDKLFVTLDTTVRALQPETQPRILVTDTVGFINKLPHDLVASFRSTLEEAHNASLLLYVVDASDPNFRTQLSVVKEVLRDIHADNTPHFLLFNKSDRLNEIQMQDLKQEFPDSILLSTRSPEDILNLHQRIVDFFEKDMIEKEILVPYHAQGIIGEMRANMKILNESFAEEGIHMRVLSRAIDLQRLDKMLRQL